jgi:hypothetical protein
MPHEQVLGFGFLQVLKSLFCSDDLPSHTKAKRKLGMDHHG